MKIDRRNFMQFLGLSIGVATLETLTKSEDSNASSSLTGQIIEAWKGERVYIFGDFKALDDDGAVKLSKRRYKKREITTWIPSWKDARVGSYFDALEPLEDNNTYAVADITVFEVPFNMPSRDIQIVSQNPSNQQTLRILDKILYSESKQVTFPMYSEVNSYNCFKAKTFAVNQYPYCEDKCNALQGPQTEKAIKLSRQFGIEPFKQSIFRHPDLRANGVYSYYHFVFEDNIAPPLIWCAQLYDKDLGEGFQPDKWLKAVNEIAPEGTMAYCADEPGTVGKSVQEAIKIIELVKSNASKLTPMVTSTPEIFVKSVGIDKVNELGIVFAPVQNVDNKDLIPINPRSGLKFRKGSYFSCMAQGNCANVEDAGSSLLHKRTDFPVAVVEGDPEKDFKRSIHLAYENKADFVLYYDITKRIDKSWIPGEMYDEGVNGDGTAMYYDPKTGDPWPSIRMMYWDIARQEVEKEILG
jgi:hypothetical protein